MNDRITTQTGDVDDFNEISSLQMKLNVKSIFLFCCAASLIFALLFARGIIEMSAESNSLRKLETDRFLMLQMANQLKYSVDNSTRFARLYANTGDPEYKQAYFNVLDVRNGTAKRLAQHCVIYWELPESIRLDRHPLAGASSITSEMERLPYLPEELRRLKEIESGLDELTQLEIKAINATDGKFEDHSDNDIAAQKSNQKSNQKLAIQLTTSREYQVALGNIFLPIDDFLHALSSRTSQATTKHEALLASAFKHILILIFIAVVTVCLSIYLIWKRVIAPIDYLTNVIIANNSGAIINEQQRHNDEIGFMIESFFRIRKNNQDDFKRLEIALGIGRQGWFDLNITKELVVVSDQYAKLIGRPAKQYTVPLAKWYEGIYSQDREKVTTALTLNIDQQQSAEVEFRRIKENGELIWLHVYGEVVEWTNEGEPKRLIGIAADVTESKQQQDTLETLAHFDDLTRLPNRNLFADRFDLATIHCKRTNTLLAICYLDLDNFKPINDQFGHATGDQLLVLVSERLKECIREEDTVSRQGGDEFTLLLGNINNYSECKTTLGRIHDSLSQPFVIDDHTHNISASSGITLYPNDAGEIDTLLRHADNAMYQAKIAGKNRFALFNPKQDKQAIYKHGRLAEIEEALVNDELVLHYQPKVNMRTGRIFGAEALIRWRHPKKGIIPPLEFLPIIEHTNLEIKIGRWVIEQALRQLTAWKHRNINIEVSVNIASEHLQSSSFVASLSDLLKHYPEVTPNKLQLEILESSVLSDLKTVTSVIEQCRKKLGVNIALDDFGTGYSSLTHLRHLSANTIKIDQTFVRDVLEDPGDYAIIDGVISLANAFDREVIAEGIETIEQGFILLLMRCELAQGYGIAKPMPANEIPGWLDNFKPNQQWIKFANTQRSRPGREREILKLIIKQRHENFVSNLSASANEASNWPIMGERKCSCGTWIKRAKQEQLFDDNWLKQVDVIHMSLHKISNQLKEDFERNNGRVKKNDIDRLEASYQQLLDFIQ